MLQRLLGRREPVQLRFARRECVLVPQTPARVALHADVHFEGIAAGGAVIEDAVLVWERLTPGGRPDGPVRTSRWDRAVIDGRFRYPPQALEVELGPRPRAITLTFTDPLIPHGPEEPPRQSALTLEIRLRGVNKAVRRRLWSLSMQSWDGAAISWLGGPETPA